MCEPATALTIGSGMLSTVGGMVQAGHQRDLAKQQATHSVTMARNQQIAAEQMAEDARKRARVAETQQRRRNKQTMGQTRSMLAASGVEMDTGSALAVQEDQAALGELEALRVRDKGTREAQGFEQNATNAGYQTLLTQHNADNAIAEANKRYIGQMRDGAQSLFGHVSPFVGEKTRDVVGTVFDRSRDHF